MADETKPADPGGIPQVAAELWEHYASGCLNAHLASVTERNVLADVMARSVAVLAKHAVALERLNPHDNAGKLAEAETLELETYVALAQITAIHERERRQAFLDAFSMGVSFMLGVSHTAEAIRRDEAPSLGDGGAERVLDKLATFGAKQTPPFFCAGEHCPGLPYRASERAHPYQCGVGHYNTREEEETAAQLRADAAQLRDDMADDSGNTR